MRKKTKTTLGARAGLSLTSFLYYFWEHEQARTRLNFASNLSKAEILRAVKNFNGPFITPICKNLTTDNAKRIRFLMWQ